jgi:hypothetical protein
MTTVVAEISTYYLITHIMYHTHAFIYNIHDMISLLLVIKNRKNQICLVFCFGESQYQLYQYFNITASKKYFVTVSKLLLFSCTSYYLITHIMYHTHAFIYNIHDMISFLLVITNRKNQICLVFCFGESQYQLCQYFNITASKKYFVTVSKLLLFSCISYIISIINGIYLIISFPLNV